MATSSADQVFEARLQQYLTNNGISPADASQVGASAVLESARSLEGAAVPPFTGTPSHPAPEFQLELQKNLLSNGIPGQTVLTLTPDHLLESVKDSLAEVEVPTIEPAPPATASDQAAQLASQTPEEQSTKRATTPHDSVLATDDDLFGEDEDPPAPLKPSTNSDSDYENSDSDEEPIIDRRRRRQGIAQKSPRKDLFPTTKPKIQTACLASLTPHQDALSLTHSRSLRYITFLNDYFSYLGYRFAGVCLTLVRAGREADAIAIGQFAVSFLGKEIFEAMVVYFEQASVEGDSIEDAKACLQDCWEALGTYSQGVAGELRARIIGTEMKWV